MADFLFQSVENDELTKSVSSCKDGLDLRRVKSHSKNLQKEIQNMKSQQLSTEPLKSVNTELLDDLNRLKFVCRRLKTMLDEKKKGLHYSKIRVRTKGNTNF